jgi:hypothetical protein
MQLVPLTPWRRWGARCGGPAVWSTFQNKEKLIYLTADSPNVLQSINPGVGLYKLNPV